MEKLLIGVDLLNDFCYVDGVLAKSIVTGEYYAAPVLGAISQRVEQYRADKAPIIWICDAHADDDIEFDRFPPHAIKDTWGSEIIAELDSGDVEDSPYEMRINKTRYSGFYGTDLEYQLSRLAPKEIEVVGVCTSICVMDTVGGLANRDYKVIVHKDSVADFDPAAHEVALARMGGLYGAEII